MGSADGAHIILQGPWVFDGHRQTHRPACRMPAPADLDRAKRLAPFSFLPFDRKVNWRKLRALNIDRVVSTLRQGHLPTHPDLGQWRKAAKDSSGVFVPERRHLNERGVHSDGAFRRGVFVGRLG
jgi:hypothetical protein